jgi:hypothetical protein
MTPTVLIFLKAPIAGQAKTRLAAGVGAAAAIEIYGKLVRRQLAAIPAGWPVEVHFTPAGEEAMVRDWVGEQPSRSFHAQREGGLGQRLFQAGRGALERGAQAVFFIGGDCGELDESLLRRAADELSTSSAVLGPTWDGGYYLLGATRVEARMFAQIDWGTEAVAEQTRERMRELAWTWRELPRLRDVDTIEDWEALGKRR